MNVTKKDGLNHSCKECHREYTREHYKKNKLQYLSRNKRNSPKQRERARNYLDSLKSGPCADCGERYPPYVMDFHHVRGKKLFSLAAAPTRLYSKAKVLAEIAKCDLVCSNCHRERHRAPVV